MAMVPSEGNMSQKNPVTPPGIDPGTVRLVTQRLNHYATPDPIYILYIYVHICTYICIYTHTHSRIWGVAIHQGSVLRPSCVP